MNHRRTLAFLVLLGPSTVLAGCGKGKPVAAQASRPPAVEFMRPVQRSLTGWDEFTGRLEPLEEVDVRARVDGYLDSIHFEDGQEVAQGDLLFVVDPRPFKADLEAAQGELQRAQASLDLANANLARGRELLGTHAIAKEEVDIRAAAVAEAKAMLAAAQAHVDSAELDVEFTEVRAPIAGRVSDHRVSVGNLIAGGDANATVLTTIVSSDPIHCRFFADEHSVLQSASLRGAANDASPDGTALPVELELANETGFPHHGVIDFVDNRVDPGTARLRVRGKFANPDGSLQAGMFARVRVQDGPEHPALLLPEKAIQTDQTAEFVLVVGKGDVAEYRPVELGQLTADGLREIRSGVAAEDRVIVAGLFFAHPGSPVTPSEAPPAGSPEPGAPAVAAPGASADSGASAPSGGSTTSGD